MTTIILTIIGILLAAAAALMVVFYGGNAFNGGSVSAQANTYMNAGTNFIAAYQLAKANDHAVDGSDDLVSPKDTDGNDMPPYMSRPALPHGQQMGVSGDFALVQLTGDEADKVCAQINKNLKVTVTPTASTLRTHKMACAPANTFTTVPEPFFYAYG